MKLMVDRREIDKMKRQKAAVKNEKDSEGFSEIPIHDTNPHVNGSLSVTFGKSKCHMSALPLRGITTPH